VCADNDVDTFYRGGKVHIILPPLMRKRNDFSYALLLQRGYRFCGRRQRVVYDDIFSRAGNFCCFLRQ